MSQARQDGITLRQWLPLVGLTCCAFVFNTSEFMPIGLLTDIAASFSLTEAQAGIMISVYAWGVMLLSLPLMVFASRFRVQADAAGRARRVLARSVPVRCGADLSHPGLRAPGGRLRTCRVLVGRLDYGVAPG